MINIYGKGGHAKMIQTLLNQSVMFYNDLDYQTAQNNYWFVGVGNNFDRKNIVTNKLTDVKYINVLCGLYVYPDVKPGAGILIAPGAVVQNGVTIGNHTIINTSASVDHDCQIGDFCHIAPNSTLCGAVKIGNCTMIGAGAIILPGIEIGENCVIGAGSVVTKNIPSGSTAYGNPAKIK